MGAAAADHRCVTGAWTVADVIFLDTNVLMYAVGRPHPLRSEAQEFLETSIGRTTLCTSAQVLQELVHAYVAVDRLATLDAALRLARNVTAEVWPIEVDDVLMARDLVQTNPGLGARDLLHLACCRRREVIEVKTFDRALRAAFG